MFKVMDERGNLVPKFVNNCQRRPQSIKNDTLFLLWNDENFIGTFIVSDRENVYLTIHASEYGIHFAESKALHYDFLNFIDILSSEISDEDIVEVLKNLVMSADNVIDICLLEDVNSEEEKKILSEFYKKNEEYSSYSIVAYRCNKCMPTFIYYTLDNTKSYMTLKEIMEAVEKGKTEFCYSTKGFPAHHKEIDYEVVTEIMGDGEASIIVHYKNKYYKIKHVSEHRGDDETLSWYYRIEVTEISVIEVK